MPTIMKIHEGKIKGCLIRCLQKSKAIYSSVFIIVTLTMIFDISSVKSLASPFDSNQILASSTTLPVKTKPIAEDNDRLTKKIAPVIQKSFNRYPSYYLFIFIGGFVLFALIRLIDPSYLSSVFASAVNSNLLLNLFKEGIFGFNITSLLLDLVCICMMGIYIQVFFFSQASDFFLWILGFTAIAYILKLILIQFFAYVFMGRTEALIHLLMHLLFTRLLGLILLPLLFFALYQPVFNVNELLRIMLIVIFCLYMVWLFRLFVKMKSVAAVNIFYLFLYLCTVEISTLAILLRNYIRIG